VVAGILLTGGESRRLGVDKARVIIDGETLAARTARMLATVCEPCVEVGSGASRLPSIRESPPGEGPLAALVAGARHLGVAGDGSVVLLACDMPMVSAELLRFIVDRPAPSAVPIARGRPQYGCAKYGGAVLDAMIAAYDTGTRNFRWLDGDHRADIEWLDEPMWSEFAPATAFRDVDTRDDAEALGIRIP
jgi:molybdopterin-guanine dinucleotide biosynthesis protein A